MEKLLSVAFDNIAAKEGTKIRKGLRQIEGLLAQLCLAKGQVRSPQKRIPSSTSDNDASAPRSLGEVAEDPAFKEFFRLQEGFEWNVASRVIACLERLLGMPSNDQTNHLILSSLDLLQGVLLLHPPSRSLFRREIYMTVLLDLLDAANPPSVQSQALLVLVSALLATPENTRIFEKMDGLLTVASLFRSRSTSREVKMKVVEFLYFYLMPEMGTAATLALQRQAGKRDGSAGSDGARPHVSGVGDGKGSMHRSTQEKQQMLGRYLSNVAELVHDLRGSSPFALAV